MGWSLCSKFLWLLSRFSTPHYYSSPKKKKQARARKVLDLWQKSVPLSPHKNLFSSFPSSPTHVPLKPPGGISSNQSIQIIQNAIMIHYDIMTHQDIIFIITHQDIINVSTSKAMTHQGKQLYKTITHHQDLCNVTIKTAHQTNNWRTVQMSLLLNTVSLLSWFQSKSNKKHQ